MLFTQADWRSPAELPDLRRVGLIALDTETKDGGLIANRGSGWPWGDGYICGISGRLPRRRRGSCALFPAAPSRQPKFRS